MNTVEKPLCWLECKPYKRAEHYENPDIKSVSKLRWIIILVIIPFVPFCAVIFFLIKTVSRLKKGCLTVCVCVPVHASINTDFPPDVT